METKPTLGRKFLDLSAISAYGIWVIIFFFPLTLAGLMFLIDERRSQKSLILSAFAIGIIAASYIFRFYLVRNTESLRTKVLQEVNREQAIYLIIGGFWWWTITLICAIITAIYGRNWL